MAVHFITNTPNQLLTAFKKAIDDKHVVTWGYDTDGDFTHTAEQWKHLAWFRPRLMTDRLVFNTVAPQNGKISTEVYAIYHGRLIESMLAHLDKLFSSGNATAFPESPDKTGNQS